MASKIKNFVSNLKKLFGHNNTKTIKEQGILPLGAGLIETDRYIQTQALLRIPYFMKSVDIIASDFASLNFEIYKFSKSQWSKQEQHRLNYLMNRHPNSEFSGYEFKKWIVFSLFIYGAAVIYVSRNQKGEPEELIPIFRNYVKREVIDGIPHYTVDENVGSTETSILKGNQTNTTEPMTFTDEEIIWIPFQTLDNVQNTEFRTIYSMTLNKIKENDYSTLNAFTNDVGLSMFIKLRNNADGEQEKKVAANLKATHEMMKKYGFSAFVYDDKMEVTANDKIMSNPITLDLRKYVAQELAALTGVPAAYLGIENFTQSTNQIAKQYLDRGLNPVINQIITKIEYFFFKNDNKYRINYNVFTLSGLDLKDKMEVMSKGISAGVLTINEAREMIGYNPREDGDKLIANLALAPVDQLGENISNEEPKEESDVVKQLN